MYFIFNDTKTTQSIPFNDRTLINKNLNSDSYREASFIGFFIYDEIKKLYIDDIDIHTYQIKYTNDKSQCLFFENLHLINKYIKRINSKFTLYALFDLKIQPFFHDCKIATFESNIEITFPFIDPLDEKIKNLIFSKDFNNMGLNQIFKYLESNHIPINFKNLIGILSTYNGAAINCFANFVYDLAYTTNELLQLQELNLFKSHKMNELLEKSITSKQKKERFFKIENESYFFDGKIQTLNQAIQNVNECYHRCDIHLRYPQSKQNYLPPHRYFFYMLFKLKEDYFIKLKSCHCIGIDTLSSEFNNHVIQVYNTDDILKYQKFCKKTLNSLERIKDHYELEYKKSLKNSNFSHDIKKTNKFHTDIIKHSKLRLNQISEQIKKMNTPKIKMSELKNRIDEIKLKLKKIDISLEKKTISQDEYNQKKEKLNKKILFITAEIEKQNQLTVDEKIILEELYAEKEELCYEIENLKFEESHEKQENILDFSCLDLDFNHKDIDELNFLWKSVMKNSQL